jgi:hypothetical protein
VAQAIMMFPCQTMSFLIKYLVLPLSVSKLPKSALQPLIDKIVDRLPAWKGHLMHYNGHLTLINTTLASTSVYTTISFHFPLVAQGDAKDLQSIPLDRHEGSPKKCLVAWTRVQRPLHLGGLGIRDFNLLGRALRLRWLWLSRTDKAYSWAAPPVLEDVISQAFF